jgi:hypothetical protein
MGKKSGLVRKRTAGRRYTERSASLEEETAGAGCCGRGGGSLFAVVEGAAGLGGVSGCCGEAAVKRHTKKSRCKLHCCQINTTHTHKRHYKLDINMHFPVCRTVDEQEANRLSFLECRLATSSI